MATITLDLTGLKCPLPALRTKKAFATLQAGDRLIVQCTDPMAAIDIPHLVNSSRHRLLETNRVGDVLVYTIRIEAI